MSRDRRKRSRVSLELPVTVTFRDSIVRGMVQDLSLKGLSCTSEDVAEAGRECDVVLELDSGIRIRIHGRVVRPGQNCAIDFLSMDETSFAHLRNLVRLYADDADMVDDEMLTPAFVAPGHSPE